MNAEVAAVEALPMFPLRMLHWSLAGTYICWPGIMWMIMEKRKLCLISPVFVPQISGGDFPPGVVTVKESVSQFPILFAVPEAAAGPTVTATSVT